MKQIVLSFSDAALFAEIAVILFIGIFLTTLYRITFVSPQRCQLYARYARYASLALEDNNLNQLDPKVEETRSNHE